MLTFLSPIWLFALAALVIPIAIHLWSKGEQSVIRVGSVRFVKASSQQLPRKLALSDLPLLLMQLGVLALLALLLARPQWLTQNSSPQPSEKWVLVSPWVYHPSPDLASLKRIDSLETLGYQSALLAPGFPDLTEPSLQDAASNLNGNTWSLLKEFDTQLPDSSSIYVIAPAFISSLEGERIALESELTWYRSHREAENHWIASAYRHNQDSLHLTVGYSNSLATTFSSFLTPLSESSLIEARDAQYAFEIAQDSVIHLLLQDAFPADNQTAIENRPSWKVYIFYDTQRSEDARYVQAAALSAGESMGSSPDLVIEAINNSSSKSLTQPATVFWLSQHPAPEWVLSSTEQGGILIEDMQQQGGDTQRRTLYAADLSSEVRPYVTVNTSSSPLKTPVWTDEFGASLLTRAPVQQGYHYRFSSRFNPAWTSLVYHSMWPAWVLAQATPLQSRYTDIGLSDRRQAGTTQALPMKTVSHTVSSSAEQATRKPLFSVVAFLVLILFTMEYIVAHKRSKNPLTH